MPRLIAQKSMMSPIRKIFSHSYSRNSDSNSSARHARVPRCMSDRNSERARSEPGSTSVMRSVCSELNPAMRSSSGQAGFFVTGMPLMRRDHVEQRGFEFAVYRFPVDALSGFARAAAEARDALRVADQIDCERGEFARIVEIGDKAVAAMLDMLRRGSIVVSDHGKSARHRFDRDIAECFGGARKQKDIAARVM